MMSTIFVQYANNYRYEKHQTNTINKNTSTKLNFIQSVTHYTAKEITYYRITSYPTKSLTKIVNFIKKLIALWPIVLISLMILLWLIQYVKNNKTDKSEIKNSKTDKPKKNNIVRYAKDATKENCLSLDDCKKALLYTDKDGDPCLIHLDSTESYLTSQNLTNYLYFSIKKYNTASLALAIPIVYNKLELQTKNNLSDTTSNLSVAAFNQAYKDSKNNYIEKQDKNNLHVINLLYKDSLKIIYEYNNTDCKIKTIIINKNNSEQIVIETTHDQHKSNIDINQYNKYLPVLVNNSNRNNA